MNFPPQLAFVLGCVLAATLTTGMFYQGEHVQNGLHAETLIEECEQDLLRKDRCVVIAIPESELKIEETDTEKEVNAED